MKNGFIAFTLLIVPLLLATPLSYSQGRAKTGPANGGQSDMDIDAMHNLVVAREYFKLKKAYVASLQRCEEVVAANPAFSRIDEVLFIAGESSMNLADGKGKQTASQYVIHDGDKKLTLTNDELRDKARDYLSQLVKDHPDSAFRSKAEEDLKQLGPSKIPPAKHHRSNRN
jgi:outer membrane protein assembly factor BamD (BamD/ComL family)